MLCWAPEASVARILYVTGNSFNNLGDLAMIEGFLAELRRTLPEARVTFLGHDQRRLETALREALSQGHDWTWAPAVSVSAHDGWRYLLHWAHYRMRGRRPKVSWGRAAGAAAASGCSGHPQLERLLDAVRSSSLVVIGGGGVLNELFGLLEGAWIVCRAARSAGVPVAALGQTVGPFHSERSRRLFREIVEACEVFDLREGAGSLRWIREAGADEGKVSVSGDQCLLLDPPGPTGRPSPEPRIALNPRYLPESNPRTLAEHLEAVARVAEAAALAIGGRIRIVPSLYRPPIPGVEEKPHMDRRLGLALRERLAGRVEVEVPEGTPTVATALRDCAEADVALSIAYHPILFALQSGTPCLMLCPDAYQATKNVGLAELWGMPEAALDLSAPDAPERAADFAGRAVDRRQELSAALLAKASELRERVRESTIRALRLARAA
ncbi:MAG: polysaccharide pyruvyl transferase family protein [Fimbriimonadales bacterium]|nr:polysaccharide pyruvyl transferase family protein [Fimbriimonadales bacterium]